MKELLDVNFVNEVVVKCKSKGVIIGKNGVMVVGYNNVFMFLLFFNIEESDIELLLVIIMYVFDSIK